MMKSVNDRYTVFLTPKEFAGLNEGLDGGDFGGTGIVIQVDDKTKYISVENVVPDGPADKAGIAARRSHHGDRRRHRPKE